MSVKGVNIEQYVLQAHVKWAECLSVKLKGLDNELYVPQASPTWMVCL